MNTPHIKYQPLLWGLILLLAFALRLIALGERSLWYDEAFAVLFSEKGLSAMVEGTLTPVDGAAADVHPLLYYTTLDFWMKAVGQSPVAVRFYSVLAGLLTVAVTGRLATDWFGARTGRAAGVIVAISPFPVQYSQEARMYALMGLVLMLATWSFWRAWRHDRWRWWMVFGALAGLAMYVQQLAAVYLLALGMLPLWTRHRRQAFIVKTGLAASLALVIYAPWMINLPDQMGKLRQYWVQKPNVLHLWLALRSFVSVNLDFSPSWWLPTFLLAAVVTVLLLFQGRLVLRKPGVSVTEREALRWGLWLAFVPMLLMWVVSYVFQPVFLPRALLPSALIFYVLVAWLFASAGLPRGIVGVLVAGWGVVAVFGLSTHYAWDTFPNPPFPRAVAYLDDHMQEGDVVVHSNKITALPMVFYDRALKQRFVRDIPGSGSDTLAVPTQQVLGLLADDCVAQAASGATRVWYVTFDQFEGEMADLVRDDPENVRYDSLAWLNAHLRHEGTVAFNDLALNLFSVPEDVTWEDSCE